MKNAKHSRVGSDGKLYVDCSECERGGNGAAKDKCSCGWQTKRPKRGGCYLGTLRADLGPVPLAVNPVDNRPVGTV